MTEKKVQIAVADGSFDAFIAAPPAPKAAVVVIQEIFGVNEGIREKARWLAKEGFLAIAPDLFWRLEPGVELTDKSEAEWSRAFGLMQAFDMAKGIADIQATIDHVRTKEGLSKVGAVGYCMGGLAAYLTSANTNADCSVGYYGVMIDQQLQQGVRPKLPLVLHIAGKDQFVQKPAQEAILAGLKDDKLATLYQYADQDHGFTRTGGAHFDAHAAELADARTVAFFKQHLG